MSPRLPVLCDRAGLQCNASGRVRAMPAGHLLPPRDPVRLPGRHVQPVVRAARAHRMPPVPGIFVFAAALYEQGAVPMQPSLHASGPEREPRVSKVPRGRQLFHHRRDVARAAVVTWVLALAARRCRCEALPRLQPRVRQHDWLRWPRYWRWRGRVWERLLQAEAQRPVLLRLRPRARARV